LAVHEDERKQLIEIHLEMAVKTEVVTVVPIKLYVIKKIKLKFIHLKLLGWVTVFGRVYHHGV